MPLSRRYSPEHPANESCLFGMDFSFVLPPNVAIVSAALDILTNTAPPVAAGGDWTIDDIVIAGSAVYARLTGGVDGTDYQLRWTITDSDGNIFPRTALVLCAVTS